MKYLWIIDNENYKFNTYEKLLIFFQNDSNIILNYKGKDLSILYANLLKALLYGYNFNLFDSDFSEDEILKLTGTSYQEQSVSIKTTKFLDWEDVLVSLKNSKSNVILYTSGTTGLPKKVLQPLENLIREVRINEKHFNSIWGFAYNPSHMAGLQVFFQAIFNQNPLINLFDKKRNDIYELIDRQQISHISATPTFYRLLLPIEEICMSVKRITFGGERSSTKLYNQLNVIFPKAKFSNIYASTEAGTLLSSKGEGFYISESKKGLIKILENELLIHESLLGVVDDIILIEKEWYATGDLIEWIDKKQESFIFLSRKSEMINVGGYKVNPYEVEELINCIDGVKSSRVYGRKNSILGNVLMAEVVVKSNSEISEENIKKNLNVHLQNFKVPRKIVFVNDISKGRTGKLIRTL